MIPVTFGGVDGGEEHCKIVDDAVPAIAELLCIMYLCSMK